MPLGADTVRHANSQQMTAVASFCCVSERLHWRKKKETARLDMLIGENRETLPVVLVPFVML